MTRSLTFLCALAMLAGSAAAEVQTWNIDPNHTAAQFSVRHMGISTVRGAFTKVSGTAQYDPSNPSKASVEATIDAASVDTRVTMRDNDLKSSNYFDVEKYPTITFKSKSVQAAGAGKLKITGDLTIHGTTKEVVLMLTVQAHQLRICAATRTSGSPALRSSAPISVSAARIPWWARTSRSRLTLSWSIRRRQNKFALLPDIGGPVIRPFLLLATLRMCGSRLCPHTFVQVAREKIGSAYLS
jgi:polyisoprenoid-binding protein YceI